MKTFRAGILLRGAFVTIVVIVWLTPTWLVVVNATTPSSEYTGAPVWWPTGFGLFQNIADAWEIGSFAQAASNSLLYAVCGASASVLLAAFAGFAVVIMPVRRTRLWFWVIYSGTLIPLQMLILPLYQGALVTNLYDSKWILIIVYTGISIPFAFFLARNFLSTLPPELAQAAKVDGAGWGRMLFSVYLPLMKPALLAAFAFQTMAIWNELFFAISLTLSPDNMPVMVALASLHSQDGQGPNLGTPNILAMSLVLSIPTLLLFLGSQKVFASGLNVAGK